MQELRWSIDTIDSHIHVSIIVVVPEGTPASGCVLQNPWATLIRYLLKPAVPQIAIEILVLSVFQIGIRLIDLRIDVPVRHQDVEPAIVIHVEETNSPTQQARIDSQTTGIGPILKRGVPKVGVERISVAREVRLHDI